MEKMVERKITVTAAVKSDNETRLLFAKLVVSEYIKML